MSESDRDEDTDEVIQGEGNQRPDKSLNPLQVISSVLAAGLGVQSSKNRQRDFKQGRFGVFLAAGFIFTLLFIGTVVTIVQLVLKGAGD
jgi:Protein of unknown function (DUF2970)